MYQYFSSSCLALFPNMFAVYDSKELSRFDLFTTRYNGICDINHWDFLFTLFFFKCLYCYNRPRRKEINLVWAGKEQKLASVTPFFNSIIATCCVDFNVLYCLWKMYFSFVMRVQTAVMKDEWNDKFTVVNGEGNEEESQMDSNTLGYLMICYDKHYNNFYID